MTNVVRRMTRQGFGVFAIAMTLAGCSGDSTGPRATVVGDYVLISINGSPLPFVLVQIPGYSLRIMSSTLTLNTNNTFSAAVTYQETEAGQTVTVSETCTGTYSVSGNSVAFSEAIASNTNCGGNYNGSWDGDDRLTVAFDATVQAIYER